MVFQEKKKKKKVNKQNGKMGKGDLRTNQISPTARQVICGSVS